MDTEAHDDERTPLLSSSRAEPVTKQTTKATLSFPAVAASLAALKEGKLPSSSQLDAIFSSILSSSIVSGSSRSTSHFALHTKGALSREGERVRVAFETFVTALRNLVRKDVVRDDAVQDFVWACRTCRIKFKYPSMPDSIGEEESQDIHESIQTLIVTFMTSPELRSLVHDLLDLLSHAVEQQVTESLGPDVGNVVSEVIDTGVDTIHEAMAQDTRPERTDNGPPMYEKEGDATRVEDAMPPPAPDPPTIEPKSLDELRDQFIDRLQSIVGELQKSPPYRSAIQTLLNIARHYFAHVSESLEPGVSVGTSKLPTSSGSAIEEDRPIKHLIPIIETFAGGPGSLKPLLQSLNDLQAHLNTPTERIRHVATLFDHFLGSVLLEPGYLSTSAAHRQMNAMYDALQDALASPGPSGAGENPLLLVFRNVVDLIVSIGRDRELVDVVSSGASLSDSFACWATTVNEVAKGQQPIRRDVVEWLLPRLISILGEIPLPRIEFTSPTFDAAIDAPPFVASSLVPDCIALETRSIFNYFPQPPYTPTPPPPPPPPSRPSRSRCLPCLSWSSSPPPERSTIRSTTTVPVDAETHSTLSIKGLRFQAQGIGYFARYRPSFLCFPIVESGLLDILVGDAVTGHGGLDIDLRFDLDTSIFQPLSAAAPKETKKKKKRLTILQLSETPLATITTFSLRPHESSHPLSMWFLRPILRTVVRTQLESLIAEQVKSLVVTLARFSTHVQRRVEERGGGTQGLVFGFVETLIQGYEEDEDEDQDGTAPEQQTNNQGEDNDSPVHVSTKGVVYDLEAGNSRQADERQGEAKPSGTAVGFGREGVLFPVGDASTPVTRPSASEIVNHVIGDLNGHKEYAKATVSNGVDTVLDSATAFQEETERVEREGDHAGWRSDAFDFK